VGRPVETVGLPILLREAESSGATVLHGLKMRFRDNAGGPVGAASKAELDFLVLAEGAVKEIVSAKIAPGSMEPNKDRAALRHYFEVPTDPVALSKYLWANFPVGNLQVTRSYRNAATVEVAAEGLAPMSLERFRSQYLFGARVPVQQIVVKELGPADPTRPASDRVQLPVTRNELHDLLAREIDRIL
jgi:hypothetical protein